MERRSFPQLAAGKTSAAANTKKTLFSGGKTVKPAKVTMT
jgi:hypothetical protein